MPNSHKSILPSTFNFRGLGSISAIYLLPRPNEKVDKIMREKYSELFEFSFKNNQIPFYYLPLQLMKERHIERWNYNRPYEHYDSSIINNALEKFINIVCAKNDLDIGKGGIALFDYNDPTTVFDFYPLDPDQDFFYQLSQFKDYLQGRIRMVAIDNYSDQSKDRNAIGTGSTCRLIRSEEDDSKLYFEFFIYRKIFFSQGKDYRSADELFDQEALRLSEDIKKKIERLRERGYISLIHNIMLEIKGTSLSYSHLIIDKDYKIFLSDWDMKEVHIAPLPKTIFILFLRHKEGILFKELIDYKEEIKSIYLAITQRENLDDIDESINDLVDPTKNSINEKCSRIRMAFIDVMAPELAEQYSITGKKGEPKNIKLDRDLIIWK